MCVSLPVFLLAACLVGVLGGWVTVCLSLCLYCKCILRHTACIQYREALCMEALCPRMHVCVYLQQLQCG
jgi:hypothetical protein